MVKKINCIFVCLVACLVSFCSDCYAIPKFEILNDTLNIQSNHEGEMSQLILEGNKKYNQIVVSGEMSYFDLVVIKSMSERCKTLDLSNSVLKSDFLADIFQELTNVEYFRFPKNLKVIKRGTLNNCRNLKFVDLPEQLNFIDSGSFQNCPNLSMKIPFHVTTEKNIFSCSPGVIVSKEKTDKKSYHEHYSIFSSILSWVGL